MVYGHLESCWKLERENTLIKIQELELLMLGTDTDQERTKTRIYC